MDHTRPAPEGSRAGPLPEPPESVPVPEQLAAKADKARRAGGVVALFRMDLAPLRRSRDFRLLFIGQGISFFGSMVTYVALPYQAYRLSHSSLIVGLLSLTELVPLLITAFLGGALADFVDRRRMVRLTEGAMCARGRGAGPEFAVRPPAPVGALRRCLRRRRHRRPAAALPRCHGAEAGLPRGAARRLRPLVAQVQSRHGGCAARRRRPHRRRRAAGHLRAGRGDLRRLPRRAGVDAGAPPAAGVGRPVASGHRRQASSTRGAEATCSAPTSST